VGGAGGTSGTSAAQGGTGGTMAGGANVGGASGTAGAPPAGGSGGDNAMGGSAGTLVAAGSGGSAGLAPGGNGGQAGASGSAGALGGSGGSALTMPMCSGTPMTLKDAGACSNRPIGTALAASHLSESAYATAAKEFNWATPENEMKWDAIEPTQNGFSYSQGDQIVNFAKSNGMKVKGHTLVWHLQLPSWVTNLGTADQVRSAMNNHITNVINHYKDGGVVVAWDVVNEAWENDGSKLRNSPFSAKLGMDFIDEAFKTARAADSKAKLYYNDFRADGMNAKAQSIYDMVKGMVERGVPIDGVGLQMHEGTPNPYPPVSEIAQNMQRLVDLGLEVTISEMDAHTCDGMTLDEQKTWYHDVIAVCIAQPKCTAITFWGTTDKYSWIKDFDETNCAGKDPQGCLWDNNFAKKPAYDGVMQALMGM
jgi:endo-1,4-beta-xylanase